VLTGLTIPFFVFRGACVRTPPKLACLLPWSSFPPPDISHEPQTLEPVKHAKMGLAPRGHGEEGRITNRQRQRGLVVLLPSHTHVPWWREISPSALGSLRQSDWLEMGLRLMRISGSEREGRMVGDGSVMRAVTGRKGTAGPEGSRSQCLFGRKVYFRSKMSRTLI